MPSGLEAGRYLLISIKRPANVGNRDRLAAVVDSVLRLAGRLPVVFPIQPATRGLLDESGDLARLVAARVRVLEPLDYLEFLALQSRAGAVVTDSGAVQVETSALDVPCYTLASSTERRATLVHGTNGLLGDDPAAIAELRLGQPVPVGRSIPLWDADAGKRVATALVSRVLLGA
jgi:UDP-N-acetylglucosamine 2-epimerase (non-hydrolysing)